MDKRIAHFCGFRWTAPGRIIISCFIALLVLWRLIPEVKSQYFFIDEYEFLRKSYAFDLIAKGNRTDPHWHDFALETSAAQPKVGPYIFGLALHLTGTADIEKSFAADAFSERTVGGVSWSKALWMKPVREFPEEFKAVLSYIRTGRIVSVLFEVATVIIVFFLCAGIGGTLFGTIAALILACNPAVSLQSVFAMTDTMQFFFFSLVLLVASVWHKVVNGKSGMPVIVWSVVLGFALALGTGVKVTGLLSHGFIIVYLVGVALLSRGNGRKTLVRRTIIAVVLAETIFFAAFWLLHPFLDPEPLNNFIFIFRSRFEDARTVYREMYPGTAVTDRTQAPLIIWERVFSPNGLLNFPGVPYIDFGLFVSGTGLLLKKAVIAYKEKKPGWPKYGILPIWSFITYAGLVIYLANDWARYYLPLVIAVTCVEAYPLAWIENLLFSQLIRELADS